MSHTTVPMMTAMTTTTISSVVDMNPASMFLAYPGLFVQNLHGVQGATCAMGAIGLRSPWTKSRLFDRSCSG